MPKYIFQQSKMPAFDSRVGKKMAKNLWDLKMYFHDSRKYRDRFVRECDEAYLCHRYVPDTGGIMLLEDGEFGESDLHDISNTISIRLALALMPRNDPWLTVSSREGETDDIVQGLQDLQMSLHRKARTRRQVQRYIKQMFVRGTSWMHYDWHEEYRLRRLTPPENRDAIQEVMKASGMTEKQAAKLARGRTKELTFSGPLVTPIDYFDMWVEPMADMISNRFPGTILQRFRHLEFLKSEKDENDDPMYSNLDGIEPFDLEELYSNDDFLGNRRASDRLFGAPPIRVNHSVKLTPVYIFHLPYYECEGLEFFDTYFHLALDRSNNRARLIKVEENPNDMGLNNIIGNHYIDWFTQTPYGLSGMQFQISKYHQKNFLQLLMVTGMAHSVIPPNLVYEPAFRSEEELNFGAGANIPVQPNDLGLEVIKPLAVPGASSQLGEQFVRFMADELKAGTGVDGLASDSSSRTISGRKTATEINRDVSSGSYFLDNQAENLNDDLSDMCMGVFQLSQHNLKPNAENFIEYERYQAEKFIQSQVSLKDLQTKRSIQVTGVIGQLNKQQDLQNLNQFFQTIGQIPDPAILPLKVWVAQSLAQKMNIKIPQQFLQDPNTLVAENPEVQMAAIQKGLENPQIAQAAEQLVMQNMQHQAAAAGALPPPGVTNGPQVPASAFGGAAQVAGAR